MARLGVTVQGMGSRGTCLGNDENGADSAVAAQQSAARQGRHRALSPEGLGEEIGERTRDNLPVSHAHQGLDGADAESQFIGDFAVGLALGEHFEHRTLALGQPGGAGAGA